MGKAWGGGGKRDGYAAAGWCGFEIILMARGRKRGSRYGDVVGGEGGDQRIHGGETSTRCMPAEPFYKILSC